MPSNLPWVKLVNACVLQVAKGHIIYQKVTCAGCGERIGCDEPNRLYTKIRHDDGCGAVTDCEKDGGGFMLTMTNDRSLLEKIHGEIPTILVVVEASDGPQKSGKEDRVEGIPPRGSCS